MLPKNVGFGFKKPALSFLLFRPKKDSIEFGSKIACFKISKSFGISLSELLSKIGYDGLSIV